MLKRVELNPEIHRFFLWIALSDLRSFDSVTQTYYSESFHQRYIPRNTSSQLISYLNYVRLAMLLLLLFNLLLWIE